MNDGEYTIYAVQTRTTHESPWLKPKGKLAPVDDDKDWFFASFDHFGFAWEPNISSKSHDQVHDVRRAVDRSGYFNLDYALRALKRLRKADDAGKFDSEDSYGKKCQAVRHEFRLVKITMSQKTEVVDLVAAVGGGAPA